MCISHRPPTLKAYKALSSGPRGWSRASVASTVATASPPMAASWPRATSSALITRGLPATRATWECASSVSELTMTVSAASGSSGGKPSRAGG